MRCIDNLILRDDDADAGGDLGKSGSGLDERLYALQDPNWNVVALAETDGTIAQRYVYGGYGQPTVLSAAFGAQGTPIDWEYLYTGRRLDAEDGLMYYRNRYYHPGSGRFVSRDPMTFDAGDFNLYRYCGNDPLNRTDPNGNIPLPVAGCAAGMGVSLFWSWWGGTDNWKQTACKAGANCALGAISTAVLEAYPQAGVCVTGILMSTGSQLAGQLCDVQFGDCHSPPDDAVFCATVAGVATGLTTCLGAATGAVADTAIGQVLITAASEFLGYDVAGMCQFFSTM